VDTKRKFTGLILSGVWSLTVLATAYLLWPDNGLTLNELGDFLAGTMAPLAIFWLVLGFLQQGDELKQNTEALKLQAEELRQSVEQQKELVATNEKLVSLTTKSHQKAREQEIADIQPRLHIKETITNNLFENEIEFSVAHVTFVNSGGPARNALFYAESGLKVRKNKHPIIDNGTTFLLEIVGPVDWNESTEFRFEYHDIRGVHQVQKYTMEGIGTHFVPKPFTPSTINLADLMKITPSALIDDLDD